MIWVAILSIIIVFVTYMAILNGAFLRCPYCKKIGSWRFDSIDKPVEEHDSDGDLIKSTQRQKCRRCGCEVDHIWSDHDGRELRKVAKRHVD